MTDVKVEGEVTLRIFGILDVDGKSLSDVGIRGFGTREGGVLLLSSSAGKDEAAAACAASASKTAF